MELEDVPKSLQDFQDAVNMMVGGRNVTKERAERWGHNAVDRMDFRTSTHIYATGQQI